MSMNNVDFFSNDYLSEMRKEGKGSGERAFPVNGEERNIVHFEAALEVPNAFPVAVRMRNDDNMVTEPNKLACYLEYVNFNPPFLREEEVTNHRNSHWLTEVECVCA